MFQCGLMFLVVDILLHCHAHTAFYHIYLWRQKSFVHIYCQSEQQVNIKKTTAILIPHTPPPFTGMRTHTKHVKEMVLCNLINLQLKAPQDWMLQSTICQISKQNCYRTRKQTETTEICRDPTMRALWPCLYSGVKYNWVFSLGFWTTSRHTEGTRVLQRESPF